MTLISASPRSDQPESLPGSSTRSCCSILRAAVPSLAAVLSLAASASPSFAADRWWVGYGSADWAGSPNWSNASQTASFSAPGEGDIAVFGSNTGGVNPATTLGMSNYSILGLRTDPSQGVTTNFSITSTGGTLTVGAEGITHNIASTFTLAAPVNNFNSAPTNINAGTLQIGAGGSTGSIYGPITNNSALIFNRSDDIEYFGGISGSGSLTKLGAGTLRLTGNNTYSGGTTVSAGTLSTSGFIAGNIVNNATLAFDALNNLTFAGNISGTGSLTKLNSGTLTLTAANTYTGGTLISVGTLQIGNGGTSGSIVGNITNNATLSFNRSDSLTFAGNISGTGSLTQLGGGTLVLSANNTYSGGTSVNAGTIRLAGVPLPAGNVFIAGNATLQFDTPSATTFVAGGVMTGAGVLRKTGANTLAFGSGLVQVNLSPGALVDVQGGTINGSFAYKGDWSGNRSSLNLEAGATFDAVEGGPSFAATFDALTGLGTLRGGFSGNPGGITTVTLGAANGSATFNGTFADSNSGRLALVKAGTGTLILTATSTGNTGNTTISGGTLQLGNGGTTGFIAGNIANNAALIFNRSDNLTFSGVISGTGSLTKLGAGTLTLTGDKAGSGLTTISAGTLQVGNGGTAGSIAGDISNSAAFVFNRSDNLTFNGNIFNTGSLTKLGAGTLTFTGGLSYLGGTTISAGALQIGNGGTTGFIDGNIINNASLIFNRSDNFFGTNRETWVISGNGSVTKLGAGAVILAGNNTYTGPTTITAGTLQLGFGRTTGSIIGPITNNAALVFNRSNNLTHPGLITGTGTISKQGAGTLTFSSGQTAPYTAASISITAGAVDLTDNELLLRNQTPASVQALITNNALQSSSATPFTRLAVFSNQAAPGVPFYSTFFGTPALATDTLIRLTYTGDTNIDGILNGADLANLIEGLSTGATGWQNGDFNYDGTINATDVSLFFTAYNAYLANPLPLGSPGEAGGNSGGSIPEPLTALVALMLAPMLWRRRSARNVIPI